MTIFAKQGEYEPCGIFTKEHFLLILLTIIGIKISLKKTINKTHKEVKQIIKKCTKLFFYHYVRKTPFVRMLLLTKGGDLIMPNDLLF